MLNYRSLVNWYVIGFLLLVGLCGAANYIPTAFSALGTLRWFAGVSPDVEIGTVTISPEVRLSLLQQLPVGTSAGAIINYLDNRGFERETPQAGQWKSYAFDDRNQQIVVTIRDAPFLWGSNLSCKDFGYRVWFLLTDQRLLNDIQATYTGTCL